MYYSSFHAHLVLRTLLYLIFFCYTYFCFLVWIFSLNHHFLQVFDARGVDVTPRPLYHPDPHLGTAKPNKLLMSQEGSLSSDFISSYSLYQNTVNPSMLGQFTRWSILAPVLLISFMLFFCLYCIYTEYMFPLSDFNR